MHVELQPVRDLLGTPRLRPPPIGPTPVTPADEPDLGARNPLAVGSADLTGEPVLHIVAEPLIGHQLRSLGPTSLQLRLPLRDRSSIVEPATPSRRVPSQLARDRRRRPAQPASNGTHAKTLHSEQRDLLAFREGQIPTRQRAELDRRHAATLAEPARPDRARHAARDRGVLAREPFGDLHPERALNITTNRRPTRRPHRRTSRQRHHPTWLPSHRHLHARGVATTT